MENTKNLGSISAQASAHLNIKTNDYLDDLNPEQREAVLHTDGPVLVLAGAGTGKTRVLTSRIAYILQNRMAFPSQILSVTFTNKAAKEMKSRVGDYIGHGIEGLPWMGTFHSIAAKILRINAELVGLKPNFTILDTDDQIRLLKQIIKAENIDDKKWTPRYMASLIDSWKNKGWMPEKLTSQNNFKFAEGKGKKVYEIYQSRLKILNACDFGDLLLLNLELFKENLDILKKYHEKFKYILVDEYQDTNICQYLWLKLLAQGSHNICVVGDDDQSIYGWRGAEVDNILRFEKEFSGAKVIKLERNYRSTEHILGAASGLISTNKSRLGKTLWTKDMGGHKVTVTGVWDAAAEARLISSVIEDWKRDGRGYNEVAILVRASRQMRSFEERFIQIGMPYRVIGGPRFFERQEIRDAHAYIRVLRSETDDLAFERIVNVPKRGIGSTTIQKLQIIARKMNVSLEQATREIIKTDEIRGKARTALRSFTKDLDRWRGNLITSNHTDVTEIVLDESGYTQMWLNNKDAKSSSRLENLKELIQAMGEFESLDAYLEHVSLVLDVEKNDQEEEEVSIMTLHSAKGLEFPLILLPGWEEGTFPSQRSMDEAGSEGLEEERRLAYVGITRARERAKIYFAANRQIYGSWQSSLPSRFIDELPPENVSAGSETGYYDNNSINEVKIEITSEFPDSASRRYNSPGWQRYKTHKSKTLYDRQVEGKFSKKLDAYATQKFKIGERIFHQKFGYGKIQTVDGNKLNVDFEKAGHKKVLDSFVDPA
ncbi:UvrD-helicase domain-containing protein [Hellea sp.]|jgi:DNA helicase-2/ATP-dependent DNA helicase PcrA|nr:UvrD-helicase domain-containing protein [Hellea sp.]MDC0422167.1 UvrD-helicase domain-containing protein [Hellea sp.]MDC1089106.1 UvrD-helicase domain-containing protein [Hellea sp.]